eukprot:g224.t1
MAAHVAELKRDLDAAKAQNVVLETSAAVSKALAKAHRLRGEWERVTQQAHGVFLQNTEMFEKIYEVAERMENFSYSGSRIEQTYLGGDKDKKGIASAIALERKKATLQAIRADRDALGKEAAETRKRVVEQQKKVEELVKTAEEDAVKPIAAAKKEEARAVADFFVRGKTLAERVSTLKHEAIRTAKQAQFDLRTKGHAYLPYAQQQMEQSRELVKQADALKVQALKYDFAARQMNANVGTIAAAEATAEAAAREKANPFGAFDEGEVIGELPSGVAYAE